MVIRFYLDPATGQPHILEHGVDEAEVEDVLATPGEDRPGRDGSRIAIGQTMAGRYMSESKFPAGWDEDRVRRVLAHYEQQTPEEAVAEDEAAFAEADDTVMKVPRDLVPAVRELIAKHQ